MLSPTFSLSFFIFIKKLFSSSLLSAIRMVSSMYLRLLKFLLAILISAYALSIPAVCMIYSAFNLNKQGENIQLKNPIIWHFLSTCRWDSFLLLYIHDLTTAFREGPIPVLALEKIRWGSNILDSITSLPDLKFQLQHLLAMWFRSRYRKTNIKSFEKIPTVGQIP